MLWREAGCCAAIAWSLTERTRVMGSCSWRWKLHPTSAATGVPAPGSGAGAPPGVAAGRGGAGFWSKRADGEAVDFSLQFRRDRCPGEQAASGRPRKVKLERVRDLLVPVL